jgi:hypothetical protein
MKNNNKLSQLGLFKEKENSIVSLDISSLGIFQRCPLEYKYRFMPRDISFDPQGTEILLGRILHLITSDYLSKPVNERNLDEYIKGYKNKLEGYFNSNKKEDCKVALSAFDKLINGPLSKMTIRATEYSFKKRIERFLLKGRVDCIARDKRGDIIIDYKIDPLELDHHLDKRSRYLQLIFYYLSIKDLFSLQNPMIAYYFFTDGTFEIIETSYDMIREGWNEIASLHKKRNEMAEYQPRRSHFCSTCAVKKKNLCPLWQ